MPNANEEAAMANTVEGRIFFPGNPWPNGHRIISCELVPT